MPSSLGRMRMWRSCSWIRWRRSLLCQSITSSVRYLYPALNRDKLTCVADYAEMVTQFGYVVVWSCVWPLAPVFALLNNYLEIRGDALKVTQHVRRPIGDRVETIGSWLDTLVRPFLEYLYNY